MPQFKMVVSNIYEIRGLGPTVTGRIESGSVRVGDRLAVTRTGRHTPVVVTAIERFQQSLTEANAVHNPVGISLSGVDRDEIRSGDVLVSD
jgi:translation elongation factor EF-Tu-like GTPase